MRNEEKRSLNIPPTRMKMKEAVSKTMTYVFLQRALTTSDHELREPLDAFLPNIYIGSLKSAFDPFVLAKYGITHIVNACQVENAFEHGLDHAIETAKLSGQRTSLGDLKGFITPIYHRICIPDEIGADIKVYFESAHDFICSALQIPDAKILIHCQAGVSRSATIAISYLMKHQNMTLDSAYSCLKSARPRIRPNYGFSEQLINYHQELFPDNPSGASMFKIEMEKLKRQIPNKLF
jgi:hypothetical protein